MLLSIINNIKKFAKIIMKNLNVLNMEYGEEEDAIDYILFRIREGIGKLD